jgi:hypothetical protein
MMSPFHRDSTHQLPGGLSLFLSSSDLLELTCTNHGIRKQVENDLETRKSKTIEDLLYYFYYCGFDSETGRISLRRRYENWYEKNVRLLFRFLPELFQFIEQHKIIRLDLSCVSSYGGNPIHSSTILYKNTVERNEILSTLREQIQKNTTLIYCNLGFFLHDLTHYEIESMFLHHPTIDCVSLNSEASTVSFRKPANMMWRNRKDGSFYWDHLRNEHK